MFKAPGKSIKGLAKVIFWITVVIYGLSGLVVIIGSVAGGDMFRQIGLGSVGPVVGIIAGVLLIALGVFIAWLSVLFMYAFGAVVDDVQVIRQKLTAAPQKSAVKPVAPKPAAPAYTAPAPQYAQPAYQQPAAPQAPQSAQAPQAPQNTGNRYQP